MKTCEKMGEVIRVTKRNDNHINEICYAPVVIAIRKRFTRQILGGTKTAEIRKSIPDGMPETLLIYQARGHNEPGHAAIVATATVTKLEKASADIIWQQHRQEIGDITQEELFDYLGGSDGPGYLWHIAKVHCLRDPIFLEEIGITKGRLRSWRYADAMAVRRALNGE